MMWYSQADEPKGSRKNKLAFWRERRAGICKAPRRRRCGDIVEERQRRRCLPAAAPRRAAAPMHTSLLLLVSYDSIGHGSRSKMPSYSCASPKVANLVANRTLKRWEPLLPALSIRVSLLLQRRRQV